MKNYKTLLLSGIVILLAILFKFNICIYQTIFKIVGPGCGLTRSIIALINLDIKKSLEYNILGLLLVVAFVIVIINTVLEKLLDKKLLSKYIFKYRKLLIVISICLMIISWIRNIKNPILH